MEKVVLTLQRYEELKTLRYRAEKKGKSSGRENERT